MTSLAPTSTKPRAPRILRRACLALLFCLLTALMLAAANFVLTDDVHSYTRIMLGELYAQAGEIDTLFLGSSHSYRSFDPALVDERLGVHSFNAGSSQQLPDGSYYMLREAAAENPLKTVYLETFYTGYNQAASADVPLACYLLTDYMRPTSLNRYEYLWEMGGLATLPDLLLPARHSIATPSELPSLWRAKLTDGYAAGNYAYVTYTEEEYRGNGFVYTYGTAPYGYDTVLDVDAESPLSAFGKKYLQLIADTCAGQGIRLVLVTAPLPSAYAADTESYQAYIDAMRQFAAANGSEYWDFTLYKDTSALSLGIEDFQDAHHLNGRGAEKFTAAFCTVAEKSAAGESVQDMFYQTLAEKLQTAPDGTYTG